MTSPVDCMQPVHPGEVVRDAFLDPLGLSVNVLSLALDVPVMRIHETVKECRGVTADTAARLARYCGDDAGSWPMLQANYDLETRAKRKQIEHSVQPRRSPPA